MQTQVGYELSKEIAFIIADEEIGNFIQKVASDIGEKARLQEVQTSMVFYGVKPNPSNTEPLRRVVLCKETTLVLHPQDRCHAIPIRLFDAVMKYYPWKGASAPQLARVLLVHYPRPGATLALDFGLWPV
jgi:hypothetical protein